MIVALYIKLGGVKSAHFKFLVSSLSGYAHTCVHHSSLRLAPISAASYKFSLHSTLVDTHNSECY